MAGPNPYNNPSLSTAAQDLGIGQSTVDKTQKELDEIKRRKKLMGSQPPLGFGAAAALMGTGY